MLVLVSGGAGSGKSEYAEGILLRYADRERIYLATMQVWDQEDRRRVERHRQLRAGKGFVTLESPSALDGVHLPEGSCVLLECLSNLCANECFGPEGFDGAFARIMQGIDHIRGQASVLVVVTNELFSDGITYPAETARYLDILAGLNRALAEQADAVYEVICGLPIVWKGAEG